MESRSSQATPFIAYFCPNPLCVSQLEPFAVEEEVLFRFPGRINEESAIVTRVRKDDQTGEDMYDLQHKYGPEIIARWVPRHEVKAVPKEGEALKLAAMEARTYSSAPFRSQFA